MLGLALLAALLAGLALPALWRSRALADEVARLSGAVRDLAARLEAAEQETARAVAAAEVAGSLLVEKGVADEEDLEEARARSGLGDASGYVPARDGEVH